MSIFLITFAFVWLRAGFQSRKFRSTNLHLDLTVSFLIYQSKDACSRRKEEHFLIVIYHWQMNRILLVFFEPVYHIRSEPKLWFLWRLAEWWLSPLPRQDVSLSLETSLVKVVPTYTWIGGVSKSSYADYSPPFPHIFPNDKTRSAYTGNWTKDFQIQCRTLYWLSLRAP